MCSLLIFVLIFQVTLDRPYHPSIIDDFAKSRFTHVETVGRIILVKNEADGDIHFRIADEHGHFVVCEIVPFHPLDKPQFGDLVRVRGIRRYDDTSGHGWWEIHPVESWTKQ